MKRLINRIKKIKKQTKYVIAAIVATTIYAVASFWVLIKTGQNISDTLTASFYAFWTVEIINLTRMKLNDDKIESKEISEEDISKAYNVYQSLKSKMTGDVSDE